MLAFRHILKDDRPSAVADVAPAGVDPAIGDTPDPSGGHAFWDSEHVRRSCGVRLRDSTAPLSPGSDRAGATASLSRDRSTIIAIERGDKLMRGITQP